MFEKSQEIASFFKNLPAFNAVMDGRIYPIVANENVNPPFAIYRIEERQSASKDLDEYNVSLFLYFTPESYKNCAVFTDAITSEVKENDDFVWERSEIDFIEENRSFVGSITFKTH
jgi:hypothetical protein